MEELVGLGVLVRVPRCCENTTEVSHDVLVKLGWGLLEIDQSGRESSRIGGAESLEVVVVNS